jgi:hypothetical protein
MASPISVGTTAIVAVPRKATRSSVRFQNVGETTLFFKRKTNPSTTDYEFSILKGGEAVHTNSIDRFEVISSAANGSLAIFETHFAQW